MVADKTLISAQIESNDLVIHNADIWIDVKPRWFVPLSMAILGALAHSLYKMFKETDSQQPHGSLGFKIVIGGLVIGAIAGGLAYLLASWGYSELT